MKNALAVAKWEFTGTLRNRQFIFFTILFPLIFLGFGLLSILLIQNSAGAPSVQNPQVANQPFEIHNPEQVVPLWVAIALAFIFLFVVLFSGTFVLQNIVREKQSRVVELLLAAVSPKDLIYGKILAFGVLGLVQVLIWVAVGFAALLVIGPYAHIPTWPLLGILYAYMPWGKLVLFIAYFVLGYLFIASFSAGMGATMTDVLSGQQLQSLIIALPSALPFLIFNVILTDPNGFLPQLFSFIPPAIPGTMMLRLAVSPRPSLLPDLPPVPAVPAWEVIVSLLVLLVSTLLMMRLAAKVFEVGILMYGKSATLREIWHWVRG
jgi:ABC-2 type transport system permease protein